MMYDLPDEQRPQPSARMLDQWVRDAEDITKGANKRIGWMLASTVVIVSLQRAIAPDRHPLFLLKGGLYLELQLGLKARTTKDVDTLFRGTVEEFERAVDEVLAEPWGPFVFERTTLERVTKAARLIKPYRFEVKLIVRGKTWRRIKPGSTDCCRRERHQMGAMTRWVMRWRAGRPLSVDRLVSGPRWGRVAGMNRWIRAKVEVSFPEGQVASRLTPVPTPAVGFFGVDSPDEIVGIAMDYQIAQKTHAATDPDIPPDIINDRVRDLVDLILIKENLYSENPTPATLKLACVDVFNARAEEAQAIGAVPRYWPPTIVANTIWKKTYPNLAASVGITYSLEEAIMVVQDWIEEIDHSGM